MSTMSWVDIKVNGARYRGVQTVWFCVYAALYGLHRDGRLGRTSRLVDYSLSCSESWL